MVSHLKKKKNQEADDIQLKLLQTIAGYADVLALLANTPTKAESLVHSLEKTAKGIGLHVNANKKSTCFKQGRGFSTLNGKPLKLVDQFSYLGSNISSTKNYVNILIRKAWIAIDRLSFIWKSDHSDKIKQEYFQAVVVSVLLYSCST